MKNSQKSSQRNTRKQEKKYNEKDHEYKIYCYLNSIVTQAGLGREMDLVDMPDLDEVNGIGIRASIH